MVRNLLSFIRTELDEVGGRSRRSWANLVGRALAALLGSVYIANLSPRVEANAALFEVLALGSHALFSLFFVVLAIEAVKAGLHILGRHRRHEVGKNQLAQVMNNSGYQTIVDGMMASHTMFIKKGVGDKHTLDSLEYLSAIGAFSELEEHNNTRHFMMAPELWEYLHADPAARKALKAAK